MNLDRASIEAAVRAKVIEIADMLGEDATELTNDEIIPATGYIDSAGLLELLAWFEDAYGLTLAQEEITIDNLGSVTQMAEFAIRRKRAA